MSLAFGDMGDHAVVSGVLSPASSFQLSNVKTLSMLRTPQPAENTTQKPFTNFAD
jgi:hypothetical protein